MSQDFRFSRESFVGSVWRHRPWQKVDRRCRAGRQRPQHWNEHVTASRRDSMRDTSNASIESIRPRQARV